MHFKAVIALFNRPILSIILDENFHEGNSLKVALYFAFLDVTWPFEL